MTGKGSRGEGSAAPGLGGPNEALPLGAEFKEVTKRSRARDTIFKSK
jgi:hypothetical protein